LQTTIHSKTLLKFKNLMQVSIQNFMKDHLASQKMEAQFTLQETTISKGNTEKVNQVSICLNYLNQLIKMGNG